MRRTCEESANTYRREHESKEGQKAGEKGGVNQVLFGTIFEAEKAYSHHEGTTKGKTDHYQGENGKQNGDIPGGNLLVLFHTLALCTLSPLQELACSFLFLLLACLQHLSQDVTGWWYCTQWVHTRKKYEKRVWKCGADLYSFEKLAPSFTMKHALSRTAVPHLLQKLSPPRMYGRIAKLLLMHYAGVCLFQVGVNDGVDR